MALIRDRVGMRVTGNTCSVPSDPQSRLMYYCNCISSILPQLNIPARLIDYSRVVLNRSEEDALIQISELIGPSALGDKVIFRNDSMDCGNEFVELSRNRTAIVPVNSVIIAGQQNTVAKIMLYTGNWMNRNYYSARREIQQQRYAPRYTSSNSSSSSCVLL